METSNTVVAATEVGQLGVMQLKRTWSRFVPYQLDKTAINEFDLEKSLFDMLGISFRDAHQFLLSSQPSFDEFERWCIAIAGEPCPKIVARINAHILKVTPSEKVHQWLDEINEYPDVLSEDDLAFWHEHGYVIIKEAISTQQCEATKALICDYMEIAIDDPSSWQKAQHKHGIWVDLKYHALLTQNRQNLRIKKAFAQLWNSNDIYPSVDQCGFNPPVSDKMPYQGQPIHLDVNFEKTIAFSTQGILYLTDTTEQQGALTVVPGFHKTYATWLEETLNTDPNKLQDFSGYQTKSIAASAGDFIIWHHHLPHSSSPNYENSPRITQFINYLPMPD